MKLLLLSALIAFASAVSQYQGRNIVLKEDGTIFITGLTGRQFIINRQFGLDGQDHIYILINGYDVPLRTIVVNDKYCNVVNHEGFDLDDKFYQHQNLYGLSQLDTLYNIFRDYQGYVDDYRYEQLLKTIYYGVNNGQICRVIYDLLAHFDLYGDFSRVGDDYQDHFSQVSNWQKYGNDRTVGKQGGRLRFFGKQIIKGDLDLTRQNRDLYQYGVNPLSYRKYYGGDLTRGKLDDQVYHNFDYNDYYNRNYLGGDRSYLYNYLTGYRGGVRDNTDVSFYKRPLGLTGGYYGYY